MRLLTLLPWALALLSHTSPVLSRAVAPGALINNAAPKTVHRQLEDLYQRNRRETAGGVPDKQDNDIKDEYWDDRVNAGCNLLAAMNANDKDAAFRVGQTDSAESYWTEYSDLEEWGYMDDDDMAKTILLQNGLQLKDAFTDLGLSTAWMSKSAKEISLDAKEHFDDTEHDGVEYEATDAHFYTVMQLNKGVLIGWQKFGPAHSAFHKEPPHEGPLPKLKNWHDIAYLQYAEQAAKENIPTRSIRYIVSTAIINNESQYIAGRALKIPNHDKDKRPDSEWQIMRGAECGSYPWANRVEFEITSDEGKALMASPNGRGAALMLITHKEAFGEKRVLEKVTVWCENGQINFMFTVGAE
ncbi:hypothetical protein K491DRAFT_775600 [Lophiostoma macrostomum CBS 122681]|uniref:Uncharacterized protein n=1 Tax=Lophiostoma macrostomum CBS 122681 TaxID=1314788 RepID=A0A6A6TJN0_9PLEO|nr:hypothetical protein K491DRAFT_775600 [Lophiostoma macrostomum CBS 122681]